MDMGLIFQWVSEYGYFALFLCLWLGIAGMPIPDEVIVMTGGMISSLGLLKEFPAFLMVYAGVISGLSIGYLVGRGIGAPIIERLFIKRKRFLNIANHLVEKYGPWALCISYFFPIIRHLVPYLVGMNRMPYYKYASYSYTTGLVWTLVFFSLGGIFGIDPGEIGLWIEKYKLYWIGIPLVILIIVLLMNYRKIKERKEVYRGE